MPTAPGPKLREISLRLLLVAVFGMTFSIAIGQGALLLCTLVLLAALIVSRGRLTMPLTAWAGLIFLIVAVISLAIQPSLPRGWGRLSRLLWILTIPVAASLMTQAGSRIRVLRALVLGCGVLAIHTLAWHPVVAWRGWQNHEVWAPDFWRALIHVGSMTDGQILMIGILATLGLIWVAMAEKEKRWLWYVILALQVTALVVNYKRGAWMCGLLVVVGFLMMHRGWKSLLIVAVAVLTILCVPSVRLRLGQIREEVNKNNVGRMTMWTRVAPGIIRDHPWGIGYGQMKNELMQKYARRVERNRSHLHSNVVQVLAETGWLGLGVYLAWMVLALGVAIRTVGRARSEAPDERTVATVFALMLLALLAHGAVEYNFGDTELLILLCVIMGSSCTWLDMKQ